MQNLVCGLGRSLASKNGLSTSNLQCNEACAMENTERLTLVTYHHKTKWSKIVKGKLELKATLLLLELLNLVSCGSDVNIPQPPENSITCWNWTSLWIVLNSDFMFGGKVRLHETFQALMQF